MFYVPMYYSENEHSEDISFTMQFFMFPTWGISGGYLRNLTREEGGQVVHEVLRRLK